MKRKTICLLFATAAFCLIGCNSNQELQQCRHELEQARHDCQAMEERYKKDMQNLKESLDKTYQMMQAMQKQNVLQSQ